MNKVTELKLLVLEAISETILTVNKHHPITNKKLAERISDDMSKWIDSKESLNN